MLLLSKHILDEDGAAGLPAGTAVVVFNTESIWHYFKDQRYRDYVRSCTHVAIDGVGLAKTLRMLGSEVTRFHGPELLKALIAGRQRWTLVLAGGAAHNRLLVDRGIVDRFVELPFTDDPDALRDAVVCGLASEALPDRPVVLLISLGLPKQEVLAARLHADGSLLSPSREPVTVVPVGAAVDFLTGHRRRAGAIWRRLGLEWLPRMIREPRMIPRVWRSICGVALLLREELNRTNRARR